MVHVGLDDGGVGEHVGLRAGGEHLPEVQHRERRAHDANEVEVVLSAHPSVAEVGVAELPVRADVSVICGFVVLQPGAEPDAADLLAWCESRLAAYKRPREIRFLDALPRTANGKVQRKRLVEASG